MKYGASKVFNRASYGTQDLREPAARRDAALATRDVYAGRIGKYLEEFPGQTEGNTLQNSVGLTPINQFPRIVNTQAASYTEPPQRTFLYDGKKVARLEYDDDGLPTVVALDGAGVMLAPASELLLHWYPQAAADAALLKMDRGLVQVANGFLKPHFDGDSQELALHAYLNPDFYVAENPDNPRRPKAVYVEFTVKEGSTTTTYRHAWEGDSYYVEKNIGGDKWAQSTAPVKLARNPIVHCFNEAPDNDSGYWVTSPGFAMAAFTMNKINQFANALGNTVVMQSFGQLVMYGGPVKEDTIAIGPGKVIRMPADSDGSSSRIEYITPNAPISDGVMWLEFLAQQELEMNGIPRGLLDAPSGNDTGERVKQARRPLLELRRQRLAIFLPVERELVRAIVAVLQQAGKLLDAGNPDLWDCHVAHMETEAEGEEAATPYEKIAREKHDVILGLRTPGEILAASQPETFGDAAAADALAAKNREANQIPALTGGATADPNAV